MRGPWHASKEVQPLTKPLMTSLAEEVLCSRRSPGEHPETSSRMEAGGLPREGPEGTWTSHSQNQVRTWRGRTLLLGMDATALPRW